MIFSKALVAVVIGVAGISIGLQGCGGGGGGGPTPAPSPPAPPPTPPRTPGLSGADAAKWMNDLYYGYDESDSSSPMGLTINLPSATRSFYGNIFCAPYDNPVQGHTKCSGGRCDCRFSAAMYNYGMLVSEGGTFMDSIGRRVGIVFNQTLVQTKWTRCSYAWDGATNNKYNVGCGNGAPGSDCAVDGTAFQNICPSSGKLCTASDPESKLGVCKQFGGTTFGLPAQHSGVFQCSVPGPAINFHDQDGWTPEPSALDNLRGMVKWRLANQDGKDGSPPELKIKMWNEIVLDTRLLMPDVWNDPAIAIPAITYWKGDKNARADAKAMRDEYCKINKLDAKIPLIAIDWEAVAMQGGKPTGTPVFVADPLDGDNEDAEVEVSV